MVRHQRGFTLVELLIVIVIIGILLGIVILSWTGVVVGSRDRAREQDIRQWATAFDTYKGRYTVWPALPVNDTTAEAACLGAPLGNSSSTTLANCGEYSGGTNVAVSASSSDSQTVTTGVSKIGDLPVNSGFATKNKASGPLVYLWQKTVSGKITVTGAFIGFFENSCPSDFQSLSTIISTSGYVSSTTPSLSGLANDMASSNIKACGLVKIASYTP